MPTDPVVAGIRDGRRTFAGPEHVVVDLTNRCNLRCVACWTYSPLLGKDTRPPPGWAGRELPGPLVARLLDDLAAVGTKIVRFTGGGEPFLHPQIDALVARAGRLGLRLDLTTNATLLDRRRAELLARHMTGGELSVSLWAADEASFAASHPGSPPALFGQIRDALFHLAGIRRDRLQLVLCNVIGGYNVERLAAMFELALELGADRVYYTLVDPVAGATESLLLDAAGRAEALRQLDVVCRRLTELPPGRIGVDYLDGFRRRLLSDGAADGAYDEGAVARTPCRIGWYFCRVTASGDVCGCCRGVVRPLGNLHTSSFAEIWDGPAYAEFRRTALERPKTDPYFAGFGCHQLCDNLMHNEMLDARLRAAR